MKKLEKAASKLTAPLLIGAVLALTSCEKPQGSCFDGIKNQDELTADKGGVCGFAESPSSSKVIASSDEMGYAKSITYVLYTYTSMPYTTYVVSADGINPNGAFILDYSSDYSYGFHLNADHTITEFYFVDNNGGIKSLTIENNEPRAMQRYTLDDKTLSIHTQSVLDAIAQAPSGSLGKSTSSLPLAAAFAAMLDSYDVLMAEIAQGGSAPLVASSKKAQISDERQQVMMDWRLGAANELYAKLAGINADKHANAQTPQSKTNAPGTQTIDEELGQATFNAELIDPVGGNPNMD